MVDSGTEPNTLLPSWRLVRRGDVIQCIGGPDEIHALSELTPETLDTIDDWIRSGEVRASSGEVADVQSFLVSIGALDIAGIGTAPLRWRCVGSPAVAHLVEEAFSKLETSPVAPLSIVVRTSGTLAELVDAARDLTGPHVLLDLTGHHTISLGPFVTPHFTSCLGCYGTRLANRWGDEPGPDAPAVGRWVNVAAELLAIQIERIASRNSPLVNATMNWDLQTGAASRDHLLRAPDCPVCARPSSGQLRAPLSATPPSNEL